MVVTPTSRHAQPRKRALVLCMFPGDRTQMHPRGGGQLLESGVRLELSGKLLAILLEELLHIRTGVGYLQEGAGLMGIQTVWF